MIKKLTSAKRGLLSLFRPKHKPVPVSKKDPEKRVIRSHNMVLKKFSIDDYTDTKSDEKRITNLIAMKNGLPIAGVKEGNLEYLILITPC